MTDHLLVAFSNTNIDLFWRLCMRNGFYLNVKVFINPVSHKSMPPFCGPHCFVFSLTSSILKFSKNKRTIFTLLNCSNEWKRYQYFFNKIIQATYSYIRSYSYGSISFGHFPEGRLGTPLGKDAMHLTKTLYTFTEAKANSTNKEGSSYQKKQRRKQGSFFFFFFWK